METQEFPKMLYHLGDVTKQKVVSSQDEEDALGEEWLDQVLEEPLKPKKK